MYIPMYKNRMYETKFLREYGHLFEDDKVMPYIEVIFNKIGRTMYQEEDLLKIYDDKIKSKYFFDPFAFEREEYIQPDLTKLQYSITLRSFNEKEYLNLLMKTTNSKKAIPVISIKNARENFKRKDQITYVIKRLQQQKDQIAIRIDGRLYDYYKDIITQLLRKNDYLFFDIKEDKIDSFILDILVLSDNDNFIKIIANSPRKNNLNNGSYECNEYTDLIDNEVKEKFKEYNFNGYSDYSGLKDDLPRLGGGRGFGVAIAMLYDYTNNKYFALTNPCSSDGVTGYSEVIKNIQEEKFIKLLRLDGCLAFEYVKKNLIERNKNGTYANWNYITLLRVISEMKRFM